MESRTDRLTSRMKAGEMLFGTHTALGGAMIAEMYGTAGFDMIWIDTEHCLVDPGQVQNTLIGATAGGAAAFVRVPWHNAVMAKPYLDVGADGIIFPMINTPDDARDAVAACRYPPEGRRGFGPFRATGYGSTDLQDYIRRGSRSVWVMPQCEHVDAVRNLDAILAVPGIDALIVGPCDLSGSMGLLGQLRHPDVLRQFDHIAATAKAAGVPFGVSMNWDEDTVREWLARGANMIFCDNDLGYIMNGCRQTLSLLRNARASLPS